MRINNNLMAMNTHRQLSITNMAGGKSVEKLSSGFRINRAGDDAAGLAISEKMRAQIRGLNQASRNSQDAISLIQTAEGAMNETHAILQRMRELAVQSANDTNVSIDREQIQKEINQLTTEINRIGNTTEFNTMKLLNGEKAKTLKDGATATEALKSGNVSVASNIQGYSSAATGGDEIKAAIGSIVVEAGEFQVAADSANTLDQDIIVTKNADGTYTVELDSDDSATTLFSAVDTLAANAEGDFVYNNHGVSFTISAEADATVDATDTVTLSITSAIGTVAQSFTLEDPWVNTNTTASVASISGGITVTADTDNADVREIDIQVDSASFTITLSDTAGNTIHQDNFSGNTTLTYDDHGISFTLDLSAAISATGGLSATISLTDLGTTETYADSDYDNNAVKFQVGANQDQFMDLAISDVRSDALEIASTSGGSASVEVAGESVTAYYVETKNVSDGTSTELTESALDVSTHERAAAAITVINGAIEKISSERSNMGAVQNRLEHTIKNLDTASENLQASESRIRDVDMAKEMMEFTKNNILSQAAQSMLAQANQAPQGVLQLLR